MIDKSTTYIYHGDRLTDPELKKKRCYPVRKPNGKCYRGSKGTMLVAFDNKKVNVIGRLLRKVKI